MYTGPQLAKLLEQQHQRRGTSNLFKKDTFTLQWRTKVGSFPHPDVETMVSAGEPCGAWHVANGRPEDKRQLDQNLARMSELPLNGYIPGSSIRGIVRAWAMERPSIRNRMFELLGHQEGNIIQPGKIEFLDAWCEKPTKLVLDIVNPQQNFQVYHNNDKEPKPLSIYTLGNGEDTIDVTVAIRGIPGKATPSNVQTVWEWVQQALSTHGVGSRTSGGYGQIKAPSGFRASQELRQHQAENGFTTKIFDFKLYSQGCGGINPRQEQEFRPSHWRGWLRSWILRFLLGVMSEEDAEKTLWELMGIIEPSTRKGCVQIRMIPGLDTWGEISTNPPDFYVWEGTLEVTAPKEILNKIILPIIKFAVSTGGVGRGWRRPLHIFNMRTNNRDAARGSHLIMTHQVTNPKTKNRETQLYRLRPNPEIWNTTYNSWLEAMQYETDAQAERNNQTSTYEKWLHKMRSRWANRIIPNANQSLEAEIFAPHTCAVYAVPGPYANPIDENDFEWLETNAEETRGEGMHLIYDPNYKRNPDIGGNAADKNPHCSWASIKRINIPNQEIEVDCQEIVCLFMGGTSPQANHIRANFLRDLNAIEGAVNLFGV